MANEFLGAKTLDENLPESAYSGLADRPEVKDINGWLTGRYNTGNDFRDMALEDVITKRDRLPEDALNPKTKSEKVAEFVFHDGEGDGMNKIGEFFYSLKDSYATALRSIPLDVMNFAATATKAANKDNETATNVLQGISDLRKGESFNKDLRDFRLGVESDALSNEFAGVLGQMGALITVGAAAGGSGAVAAAGEGLAEGGQFLQTTIDANVDKPGGLKEYDGSGLTAAAGHGTLAGVIGMIGIENRVLSKLGKFGGGDFVKGVAGEALEEGLQYVSERGFRRADNAIRNENIDELTLKEELKNLGHNMAMGALGGAVVGGVAVASNRSRAIELLEDNFGIPKPEATKVVDEYMTDISKEIARNANAIEQVEDANSVVGDTLKASIEENAPTGEINAAENEKVLSRAQDILVLQQQAQDAPMADSPIFSDDETIRKSAADNAVTQAQAEVRALNKAEAQAKEELQNLEQQEVEPEQAAQHEQEIAQKQAEINTIREMNGDPAEFDVGENVNQEQIEELKNQLNSDIIQSAEEASPDPDVSVGATMAKPDIEYDDRFDTGKENVSRFSAKLSKETSKIPEKYKQRDTKAADTAADNLVKDDEARAIRFLRDRSLAQLDGLSKPEILEALYRKNKGNAEALANLEEFSYIATQAGRDVQAFSENDPWDASARIRDINNQIAREAPKKIKDKVATEKQQVKEAIKIKKEKLPSDKEIERMTRELLGCK